MVQVFMLVLFIGIGESRYQVEESLYFDSVVQCNATAQELSKRWGHWSAKDQATVYCIPTRVSDETPIIRMPIKPSYYPKPPAPPNGMMASTD